MVNGSVQLRTTVVQSNFVCHVQAQYERTVKDNDILNQRLTKAQQDYENQLMQSDQLAGENSQKNAELKLKEEEVSALKGEISRINKLREGIQRKLRNVEEQKQEVESSRESLRQQITSLERGTNDYSSTFVCIIGFQCFVRNGFHAKAE